MKTRKPVKTGRDNSLFIVAVQAAADRAGVNARTVYRLDYLFEIRKAGPGKTCEGFMTEADTKKLVKMYELRRQRSSAKNRANATTPIGT